MSETLVSKALKRAGVDPAATRGMEISELFDADQHAAAEAALAAAEASYAQSLPEEQNLIEFENPFQRSEDPTFIPGIRFPKLGTIAEQDIGSYFTIPANIASERVRLGGPLVDFEPERVKPEEVLAVLEKYNIATNERVIGKLVEATSPEDLEARATIYARRQEREEQIAVDNPGLLGFGTRILTNVLDPALLVTGGLAQAGMTVKLANSATKTGAAMRFAADGLTKGERFRVGAMTALAVDIPLEGVRATVDPNQDLLMTAGFLALTPLLGGALNSIGRNKADDLAEAAQALDKALADGISGTNSGAVGAAQSGPVPKTFPEEDLPGAPPKAGRFTIGTPLNYLARSSNSLVRTLADKLSWNPNTRSTQGTTAAEAQRRIYNAQAVRMRAGRMAAKEFFKTKGFQPTTEQLDDFFRQVGQHISGARVSTDPAILRAVEAYREGFADMLAYVRDKDHVTGRTRPGPYVPPAAPPAASAAAPNAPTPPPAAPAGGPPVATPDAPGPITRAVTDAPEPITPATPDATGINPEAPRGTARDYFGRKSFRSGSSETVPPKSDSAPEVAPEPASAAPPVSVVDTVRATAAKSPKLGQGDMEWRTVADVKDALRAAGVPEDELNEVIRQSYLRGEINIDTEADQGSMTSRDRAENFRLGGGTGMRVDNISINTKGKPTKAPEGTSPPSDGPPSRTDLRRSLQSFADAAEALGEEATEELKAALAQAQRYLAGASMGSGQVFQRKYLDALKRLAEALEEAPDGSAASKLMADIVEDLDSGLGSRIVDDGPMVARRGSPEDKARLDRGRALGFDVDTPVYRGLSTGYTERDAGQYAQWFTTDAADAADYVTSGSGIGPVRGANVIQAFVRRGKNLLVEAGGSSWANISPDGLPEEIISRLWRDDAGNLSSAYRTDDIVDAAKSFGYDSVTFRDVVDPAGGGSARRDGSPASPATVEVVFDPSNIRATWANFDGEGMDLLARRPNAADEAIAEKENLEIASIYDAYLAKVEYTGKGAKPSVTKGAVAGAAVVAATGGVGAWLIDADDDVIAGAAFMSAALGAVAGTLATKGRVRHWENNSPGYALFVSPNSPGADKVSLRKAIELEAKGVDRNTIWKKTGWGRIGEQWVTEIDEPLGTLLVDLLDEEIPLGEALKATRILEVEPGLRKLVIQARGLLRDIEDDGLLGAARIAEKEVAVNTGKVDKPQQLAILLHEVNHILQGMRGNGTDISASAADMGERRKAAMAAATKARERYYSARDAGDKEAMAIAKAELDDHNVATEEFYQYRTQVIEAESRLVERRLGMSRKERRAKPPWEDFDVPEDDLWSGQGAAQAASLGSDLKLFRSDEFWANNVEIGEFADGEVQGYQYAKVGTGPNAIYSWVEEAGDGEGIINWDWARNIEGNTLFADNLDASPSDSARAFAFAQAATERVLKSGEFDLVTFEGLKKAAPGRTASGHERMQKALMARGQSDGYVPTMGSWKTKVKDPQTGEMVEAIRSSFAFVREGMDVAEAWQNIRRGKVDIEVIEKKAPAGERLAAKKTEGGAPEAEPEDTYRGLEEWRYIEEDPAYLPRRYNKQGWDRVFNSAKFRGNTNAVGNAIGNTLYRSNQQRFDELGERLGIQGLEAAWRVGRKYAETVSILMNPAENGRNPFRKVTPDDREAAKEIVRDIVNAGESLGDDAEEAMEMLLDLVAPVKKKNAESARARPRLEMNLDAELDADIIDMFEWNVESLFTAYARNLSGYAGLLKAGFNSAAELDSQIDEVRRTTRAMGAEPQKRAAKEAEKLQLLRDAILGVPPEEMMKSPVWNWTANQLRRLNFGNLMNNTGFLAVSELGAALTQVNAVRMMSMFPAYQRYIKQARAGDPAAVSNIYYLADVTMGHGSAQVRSRIGDMAERADMAAPSLADRPQGAMDKIDRFTRKQANLVGRFSGMSPIQEFLRMTIVTAEAQDWVKAARKGRPLYSARRMAALGVDAAMWQRISGQLRKWGDITSPDSQQQVPNMALDVWDDAEALNAWINALDRNANRLVMEGDVGHQAFWLRNRPSNQLLFQFLNFPMNAFSKHLGFALNVQDARVGQEMLAMSIGGMAGYYARVYAQAYSQDTEEEREAFIAERATAAEASKAFFYYGAHYSLAPNAVDFALFLGKSMNVPNPIPGYDGETVSPLFSKTRGSGLPGDPFTGNPTYSRASRAPGVIGENFTGTKFSEQDVQGLVKHFAPLGNHIALNAFLDRALEFLPDEEGSVEDQVQ